jgi:DNA polymerase III epsilon subunit family exonuclease
MEPQPESDLLLSGDLRTTTFAVLDTETTGCGPNWGHRICEVGVVRWRNGRKVSSWSTLVNPQRAISPGAAMVHGITDDAVRGAPVFREVADDLASALDGAVFVAHNAPFDLSFLAAEFRRVGRGLPVGPVLDTLRIARRTYDVPSVALQNLAPALRIRRGTAHRALGDAETTARLLGRILRDLGGRARTVADLVRLQGGPVEPPAPGEVVLPEVLAEALRGGLPVAVRYVSAGGVEADRVLEPREVFAVGERTYVRAFCRLRGEERVFRLDRVRAMGPVSGLSAPGFSSRAPAAPA